MDKKKDASTNDEISPIKKVVDILEENKFRVLKIEEDFNNIHAYKGTIILQIVPKNTTK